MERLQKVIANAGYCSRRKAEELITQGNVKVNSVVVRELGTKVNEYDKIDIYNKRLVANNIKVYIMLNKPRNCVSTMVDPQNRKTVINFVKEIPYRIYPVGRLDYDTSGLLLLTNDGDFTNIITHPSHLVSKKYHVLVTGHVSKHQLHHLAMGVEIEPGIITHRGEAKLINYIEHLDQSVVALTIHEGRKHQVKKMIEVIGKEVVKLKRVAIGFLEIDDELKAGEWRYLKPKEVKRFYGIMLANQNKMK